MLALSLRRHHGRLAYCLALIAALASHALCAAADTGGEVFVGFDEPHADSYWAITGDGVPCKDAKPRAPGSNRFCAHQVRFEKGRVTLSGEVAALGAVGSAITLRRAPGAPDNRLFPSEGTFAAKIRFRDLNDSPNRFASVKAFFTYAVGEGQSHFENDFEVISEANAISSGMLMPFARQLVPTEGDRSAESILRQTRRVLPLVTTATHVAKDGANHLMGGAAPLGRGRAPVATFVVQNRCREGCAQTGTRVYESTYSMAVEGRGLQEIGRTQSTHAPGGYDDIAAMFNLWWMKGETLPPAGRARKRQEMQVLWFLWQRDASAPVESVIARGNDCDEKKARCSFETSNKGARLP